MIVTWLGLAAAGAEGTELTASFQQGVGGYRGCQDTYLVEDTDEIHGSDPIVIVDCCEDDPGGFVLEQGLLRFDGIFGTGAGQIPLGAKIIEATLRLTVINPGSPSTSVHRMLQPWYECDESYNLWMDGVQRDDVEARSQPDLVLDTVGTGPIDIPVTNSVQAWSDGEANSGWLFFKYDSDDGWIFHSSEAVDPNHRPLLMVKYAPPCPADLNDDCVVGTVDLLDLLAAWGPCAGCP